MSTTHKALIIQNVPDGKMCGHMYGEICEHAKFVEYRDPRLRNIDGRGNGDGGFYKCTIFNIAMRRTFTIDRDKRRRTWEINKCKKCLLLEDYKHGI